jgi:hypothetical protein
MQIVKTRKIKCGCDKVFEGQATLKQIRLLAKKAGWHYSRFTGWKCPACLEEDHREWVGAVKGCVEYVDAT